MASRTLALLVVSLLALIACGRSDEPQSTLAAATEPAPVAAQAPDVSKPSFVNRVWAVASRAGGGG
jgi:hypothetical protein